MRLTALLLFLSLPGLAAAATMRELLEQAMRAEGETVQLELEGQDMAQLREAMKVPRIVGTAKRIKLLAQPGCGRYEVSLSASAAIFATVKLNLCPGGLPPEPRR